MEHSTVKRLAAGAAAATIAFVVVGAGANAAIRPDDRATRGPGAVAVTNAWVVAERARPDDRPAHGAGAIEAARREVVLRPDDRSDRRLPSAAPVAQPVAGTTFDWVDAGIGSAATFGLVVLAAGASLMLVRRGAQTA